MNLNHISEDLRTHLLSGGGYFPTCYKVSKSLGPDLARTYSVLMDALPASNDFARVSIRDLARKTGLPHATLARQVNELCDKNLVQVQVGKSKAAKLYRLDLGELAKITNAPSVPERDTSENPSVSGRDTTVSGRDRSVSERDTTQYSCAQHNQPTKGGERSPSPLRGGERGTITQSTTEPQWKEVCPDSYAAELYAVVCDSTENVYEKIFKPVLWEVLSEQYKRDATYGKKSSVADFLDKKHAFLSRRWSDLDMYMYDELSLYLRIFTGLKRSITLTAGQQLKQSQEFCRLSRALLEYAGNAGAAYQKAVERYGVFAKKFATDPTIKRTWTFAFKHLATEHTIRAFDAYMENEHGGPPPGKLPLMQYLMDREQLSQG